MERERGTHPDDCANCGSTEVYHDLDASGERRQWYDCLSCGTRLMVKWAPEDSADENGEGGDEWDNNRFSDFDFGTAL